MKKTFYIIFAVVGILALAAILYLVLSPRSSSTTLSDEIETTQIDIGPVSEIVGATGRVSSDQSALLSWKTSGLVADTYVQVGDQVQAGEVLAVLDPGSLSPLDILAQAELVAARRALDNLISPRPRLPSHINPLKLPGKPWMMPATRLSINLQPCRRSPKLKSQSQTPNAG